MMLMEQHTDRRREESFFEVNQTNTVNFILNHVIGDGDEFNANGEVANSRFTVTADEINAAIDVLDVNAFEIRGDGFSARGVFPLTAMMNSVCSPNTQVEITVTFFRCG